MFRCHPHFGRNKRRIIMNILISNYPGVENEDANVVIVGCSREDYEKETDGEVVIAHEPLFGKPNDERDAGERAVAALAETAGVHDESVGNALERLVRQAYLIGLRTGIATERERIVARIAGLD